ncbi:MAG TPA: STAS domain-containing protein [Actinotalea sp.]|nr:STAS domain-containing protein [Actinotalea sp.]
MNDVDDDPTRGAQTSGLEAVDLDGGTLVRMWGDVDAGLRGQASAVMARALQHGGPVVIDASEVEFLDSSGLAFILQLLKAGEEEGRPVVLRDPPTLVLDMIDLLGMTGQVPLRFTAR